MNSTENCSAGPTANASCTAAIADADSANVTQKIPQSTAIAPTPPHPVELPPEFKTSLVDIDVVAGSTAKFVVQLINPSQTLKVRPPLEVSWYHNGFPITNSDRHLILQEGEFFCVQITNVSPKDEGQWTCRAENLAGGMSCCCVLHVTCPPVFAPPEFVSGLRGCLWDNGTISLECEVKGKPTPTLRWYKDGSPIIEGASLTIKASSKERDTMLGIFACEAQNCMGSRALYSKVYAKNFCDFLGKFSPVPSTQQPQKTAD